MRKSVVHTYNRVELPIWKYRQIEHVCHERANVQSSFFSFPASSFHSEWTQIASGYLKSHFGQTQRLCANPACTIQDLYHRRGAALALKDGSKYRGLAAD